MGIPGYEIKGIIGEARRVSSNERIVATRIVRCGVAFRQRRNRHLWLQFQGPLVDDDLSVHLQRGTRQDLLTLNGALLSPPAELLFPAQTDTMPAAMYTSNLLSAGMRTFGLMPTSTDPKNVLFPAAVALYIVA